MYSLVWHPPPPSSHIQPRCGMSNLGKWWGIVDDHSINYKSIARFKLEDFMLQMVTELFMSQKKKGKILDYLTFYVPKKG